MEAIILGTAAAEGIPALFCGCERCKKAREMGGKEIRARSALFLPPDILVDLGPDCLYAVHRFGLDWSGVEAILFTHSHQDHLLPSQLGYVREVFASNRSVAKVTVFGNDRVRQRIADEEGEPVDVEVKPAVAFETISLPNANAVPIPSHHKADGEETFNYIITRDGKSLLYACDTGSYDDETMDFLKGVQLDGAIIECTFGPKERNPQWPYHLGMPDVAELRNRLKAQGTLKDGAPVILTHFSHNGIVPYEEFSALAAPLGLQVAYDGMRVML